MEPRLKPHGDEEVLDAGGGAALPGLHDHHVHLRAAAAAALSIPLGPPLVATPRALERCLRRAAAATPPGEWLRGVGYHESVAGELDRSTLDQLVPDHPLRVQHRSGALWILNSAALGILGLLETGATPGSPGGPTGSGNPGASSCGEPAEADRDDQPGGPPRVERDAAGQPTGRLWRCDSWLAGRIPHRQLDWGALGRAAAATGVTGFTDATPGQDSDGLATLASAQAAGLLPQRLHLMAPPGIALPSELHQALVSLGPAKVLLDDDRLPSLEELVALVRHAHREGRPVAIHCVTRVQAALAVAAFGEAGSIRGDRLEHGAVLGREMLAATARLGLTVVTQPAFVWERGDQYLADVDAVDLGDLWRLRSLEEAGVDVAAGTDAPFGPADPWASVRAAVLRRTLSGLPIGPSEALAPLRALGLFLGRPELPAVQRALERGQPADLCLLAGPLRPEELASGAPAVAATVVAGRVVFRS